MKHSAKSIAKMIEARTGMKRIGSFTGRKHSAKSIAKMIETRTGMKHTDETRAKISETKRRKKRERIE